MASHVQYLSCLILKGRAFPLQVKETPMGMVCWDFILNLTLSTTTGLGNETGKFQNIKKKSTHEFFYLFIGHK